ncbi:MAG: hypothetical protein FD129_2907, partial [bacterium]
APARRAAEFVLRDMLPDGRLRRSWRKGKAELTAYVEDYAAVGTALVDLYEATFEISWLEAAAALTETALAHYQDPSGGFFLTADDAETILVRPRSAQDGATPSGNSMMAGLLLRLAALLDRPDFRDAAEATVRAHADSLSRYSGAHHRLLLAVDWLTDDPVEVAVIGDPADAGTAALLRAARAARPYNRVLASAGGAMAGLPLLRDRHPEGGRPARRYRPR